MNVRRAGTSLYEMMVVMALLSVVLTSGARALVVLMRADDQGRRLLVEETAFARLAERFRQDVRAATGAELLDGEGDRDGQERILRLKLSDDRTVEYRTGPDGVRVAASEKGQPLGRETYRLVRGASRFELDGPRVSLVHVSGDGRTEADGPAAQTAVPIGRRRTLRIDATRGRDLRFLGAED
jgi:type II secretory pathway component PulJ